MKKFVYAIVGMLFMLCLVMPQMQVRAEQDTEKTEEVTSSNEGTKVEVRVKDAHTIVLTWTADENASRYDIYQHCTGEDGYTLVASVASKKCKYVSDGLASGKKYVYKVETVYEDNADSLIMKSEMVALPIESPQNVSAKKNGFYIDLQWDYVADAVLYEIYRSEEKTGTYKLLAKTKECTYTDKKVSPSTKYYYQIKARNSKKNTVYRSDFSKVEACTTSNIDPNKPIIALTFDDGPSPNTPKILKTLKKYDAHATFFVVGNRVNANSSYVKQAYEQGCEIGNHSWDHANLGKCSQQQIRTEINKTDRVISEIIGKNTTVIRPPYGSLGSNLRTVSDKPLIIWSIDTLDWKYRNASSVYGKVVGKVKDGDIVLMHDLYGSTASAVEKFVPVLKKQGYQMVSVSELAVYKQQKLEAGQSYHSIR